ncbi:endonuclease/exonuclease/phosphatase family protein [Halegenticoccus soli]|uniref:endonuclease/exonuclease/phosphatase family protein n=1 Tax=Halegenticoccus soli TaxID=1985678 RepID=UPI0018EAF520|nr:endonuclease/exonuclease/phosphatase family protein [Halegenticoccus soli]
MQSIFDTTRRRFLLGGLTALGATTGLGDRNAGFGARSDGLRACSFNIRYDNPEDEYRWEERRSRVVETVSTLDPGLLGVQEAQPNQYDYLREALDDYEWYGVGREDGDREGEFVPLAWRTDRFEALETGAFWLSETPGEPSVGWDAELPRVTTWARLSDRETGTRLWFCNTHFSHVGERARVESARLVRERARERAADGEEVVVTGDFNLKPSEKPYQLLTGMAGDAESPVVDPRREADTRSVYGPWGTYHGFTPEIEDRIDYIFTTENADVGEYRTLDVREGEYRSDHLPVVADFELARRPRLPWKRE